MVLGDAMMERGIDRIPTGRSRPVPFYLVRGPDFAQRPRRGTPARIPIDDVASGRVLTRGEYETLRFDRGPLGDARARPVADGRLPLVGVRGREVLYNVPRYAAQPNEEERWGAIFTMWITTRREIYRALVAARALPRSIRFHELVMQPGLGEELSFRVFLERTPPRRQRPVRIYLFDVFRDGSPATEEVHFYEDAAQLQLLG